jgi:DNA polymerase-3 subunit delta'
MTLLGHDEAWRAWQAAVASERMHHAWLLVGPRGLGKGSFARAAAAALVSEAGVVQPAPGMHPDVLLLDHQPADDDEMRKRDDGKPFKLKRNISIDQIRRLQTRLTTRPTLGERRAIIIDPADDMERGAANALLKSLEEPPRGSTFLLVAHQTTRLPPTIRSRCRVLRFAPLADAEIDALLRQQAPAADEAARAAAILAAHGAPGAALAFVERSLAPVATLMRRLIEDGDREMTLRTALAQEVGPRPDRERIAAVFDLARATLGDALIVGAKSGADRDRQSRIIDAHVALSELAAQAPTYNFDPALLTIEIGGLLASAGMPKQQGPKQAGRARP